MEGMAVFLQKAGFGVGLPPSFGEEAPGLVLVEGRRGIRAGMGGIVEILEVGPVQEILVVHQRGVHAFAVHQEADRLADADIIEGRAAHVHGETLEPDGLIVGHLLANDPVVGEFFAAGLVHPEACGIDGKEVYLAFLEGFESSFVGIEELELQGLEVGGSVHTEGVSVPPVGAPLQGHRDAFLDFAEAIGAGHDGKLEVDLIEVELPEGVAGKNLEGADGTEVAPMDFRGSEADAMLVNDGRAGEFLQHHLVGASEVGGIHDGIKVPLDVAGGNRSAITPACSGIQPEGEGVFVVGDGPFLRQTGLVVGGKRVKRKQGFIERAEQVGGEGVVVEVVVEALGTLEGENGQFAAGHGIRRGQGIGLVVPAGLGECLLGGEREGDREEEQECR